MVVGQPGFTLYYFDTPNHPDCKFQPSASENVLRFAKYSPEGSLLE